LSDGAFIISGISNISGEISHTGKGIGHS